MFEFAADLASGSSPTLVMINPVLAPAQWAQMEFALVRLGRVQEAIGHFQQVLRIDPDLAEVHYNLGNALAQTGRVSEAIVQYEQALRIKTDYTQAQNALARLKARQ